MSKINLKDLPAAAQNQVLREKSRELGRGNKTVPQPEKEVKPCSELNAPADSAPQTLRARSTAAQNGGNEAAPTSDPAGLRTFYRAAACTAFIKEVQTEKQPKDEAGGKVRFFTTEEAAWKWVDQTITDEQNRLHDLRQKLNEELSEIASEIRAFRKTTP